FYWGLFNVVERPDDAFVAEVLGGEPEGITEENIQARARGLTLMADLERAEASHYAHDPASRSGLSGNSIRACSSMSGACSG
ncbi:MAG: hypothetical protein HC809_12880, partial [Gammaproteobacteria bacterium]|nr:hypothetical protein [Gammaproteobacteria bacterium]